MGHRSNAPKGVSVWTGKALDSIREGERISFTCHVQSSNPTVQSYSWYKDWSQLGCTDRELNLTDIKLQDTGHYYCRATNFVLSSERVLTCVNRYIFSPDGPRDTRIVASEGGVKVGWSLTLTCHAEALPEPNRYTWFHALPLTGGWTEVPAPSNRPSSDRRALSWEQIRVSDAGEYMCQAANEISAKNSTSHRVDVLYGPTGLTLLMAATVRESSLVTIQCTVESNPPSSLNLTWVPAARLHPGLPPDPKASQWKLSARTNLSFSFNASVRDAGLYTCQAANAEGQDNTSQRLVVNYGPRKPVVIHNMTSRGKPVEESAVALMCSSESYPPINSYKWYIQDDINTKKFFKDKQNITIGNGQGGVYYCLVDNGISSSSSDKIEIRFDRSLLFLIMAIVCIILAIIIIAIIIFLVYRKRRKSTQESLQNGSRNGTRETLVMDWLGDPQRSRESLLAVAAPPLEPLANQHGSHSKPCSNITTVYSALKISGRTQQGESPAAPHRDRKGAPEELTMDHAMDYASLQFPGKRNRTGLKAEESNECVYSTVSKPNRNITEVQEADYENVKGAVPRRRTVEEDPDVCYTTVSFAAGPGPKGPRRRSDSSDEDDYRTQYSEVRA
ncbi:B-cell receptor CD22-like [Conger conger]|uniref:B-cell receptor CD22-like n=1 Tax=Conger conger TaxID=82655 RepID=UPI002A5A0168|nr:B-cell receptor CD22-like [Conger conger]